MMKLRKKLITFLFAFSVVCYISSVSDMKTAFAITLPEKALIVNERTGLQLHMDANNGIGAWNDPKNTANQWVLKPIGDYYNIVNVKSNLQLHMDANNKLAAYNDSGNQSNMWSITEAGNGYYVITNVRTGSQLHLSSDNKVATWNDSTNQSNHWRLEEDFNKTIEIKNVEIPVVVDNTSNGDKVVAYSKNFLGTPYVWGGTTPKGFDCSGFTQYVYNNFGTSIGRTTHNQINSGTAVSRDNLKVGDLVLTSPGHVGIYVGDNQMIHAPYPGANIRIEGIWSFYAARRIMN
ncbi:hypothetical protein bsdtw1_03542 [Clostridium fungisolvens]|uniref:NlpC/P60 domain-containing protein n=2 Tax=Clostridium fungisolvens TaxID=1604897 RepID=A0A6V8SJL6_9CLOT|nr:hypothetical protein bsdtw1_03542 [Clostridium fungisolvens]